MYRNTRRRYKSKRVLFILILIVVLVFAFRLWQTGGFHQVAHTNHGWNLILVNQDYRIPRNYEVELTDLSNGESVDARIYASLQKMFDDARMQGIYPVVVSGYRTADKQRELMDGEIESFMSQGYDRAGAKVEARKWVGEVGRSEHQIGLAVDINGDGKMSRDQQVYDWLAVNAWKYGFILRYADNKTDITGIGYEPWHYRFVGTQAATAVYEQGLCLEEYIQRLDE